MPRWLQTLFALREDQLIRKWRVNFWLGACGAVLFLGAAVAIFYLANVRVSPEVSSHLAHLREDARILSEEAPAEKRLMISCRVVADLLEIAVSALGAIWLIVAALTVFCVYVALATVRMRDMAREIQMLKGGSGIAGDGVSQKETHS